MADRSVKVSLVLQAAGYMQGMEAAAKKTRETGTELEKLQQKREAFTQLGGAAVGFGAAVGVGVGMAVSKFAEFDQQMSFVQAATHETAANMDLLRDAALEAGARTVYSASEAAAAIEELSKAGVSTADILGGALDGALDAAAAGGMEVAATAELMASAMSQFNLRGDQASHVADLLAAGAGKAQGGMSDLGAALNQAGLVSNQFGLSIEDTVGTLAAFANAGMLGSDAGTSLRTMLLRLANPTEEVKDLMAETGIQAYNAAGQFVGLDNLAGQLQASLGGMTQEQRDMTLAMIFGQDAIRGANILMKEGTEGIREWTEAVDDQGYAQETASIRLDNLKGDWEAFTGALDTAMITMAEGTDGPLRAFVQGITGLVDGFNALPDWMQQTALAAGVVVGGIALLGGAALIAVPQVAAFRTSLQTLGITAASVRGGLGAVASFMTGPLGIALTAATVLTAGLAAEHANGQARVQSYADALRQGKDAVDDLVLSTLQAGDADGWDFFKYGFFDKSALDAAEEMGISLERVREAASGNAAALAEVRAEVADIAGTDDPWSTGAVGMNAQITNAAILLDALEQTNRELGEGERLNKQSAEAAGESAAASQAAADATADYEAALVDMSGAASGAGDEVDDLAAKIRGFGSATLSTRDANRQFEAAVDDLTAGVEAQKQAYEEANGTLDGFRASLDIGTEEGRANQAALDEIATSTLELAAATYEQTASQEDATAEIERGRQALMDQLEQFGITGAEAEAYADELGLIPGNISTLVDLDTAAAEAALDALTRERHANIVARMITPVDQGWSYGMDTANATGNLYVGGKAKEFAAGGFASGIYPYTRGGIHKFAEEYDEAFISLDPARRDRSLDIWAETGRRLGAWQPSPSYVLAGGGSAGETQVDVTQNFNIPPGMSPGQVEKISGRGIQRALQA